MQAERRVVRGGTRAWEGGSLPSPAHPQLTSEDTVQPVLLWRGPREGCSLTQDGDRGCTGPGRRARCSGVGLWSERGRAAAIRLGRTAGGLDSGGSSSWDTIRFSSPPEDRMPTRQLGKQRRNSLYHATRGRGWANNSRPGRARRSGAGSGPAGPPPLIWGRGVFHCSSPLGHRQRPPGLDSDPS